MDEPIWCLRILLPGNVETQIFGAKNTLLPAFEKFESSTWDENEKLTVKGFCNSADRATMQTCVKLGEVTGMTMYLEN